MNPRSIAALLRPIGRSFVSHKMNPVAGGGMGSLLFPTFKSLPRLPLPLHPTAPMLQRAFISSYLQAVRMQRMAQRDSAQTQKDAGAGLPKQGDSWLSKLTGSAAADAKMQGMPPDSDASLGTREDRPLYVTSE